MLARYSDLQDRFRLGRRLQHGPADRHRAAGSASPRGHATPTETFSGGWQMRIALAKLLLGRPNLLLLDEPTNHLDLEARNWLEEYLGDYPHAVILVSHDRYFLDAVVTRITDLNLRTLTDYVGNYSEYLVEQRARMLERLRQAKREQDEESRASSCSSTASATRPPRPRRCRAASRCSRRWCRSRCRPSASASTSRSRVRQERPHGAGAEARPQGVRRRSRSSTCHLHIERGDRIALVGPNGAGKSTLMRMLSGERRPTGHAHAKATRW
jgi:ATP-binding cassette, subfamily F, member 3